MRANALAAYLGGRCTSRRAPAGKLPAHVRAKRAKGKLYYYFATGHRSSDGKEELLRLPDKHSPEFAAAVAAATLERWRLMRPRLTPSEVIVADAQGDFLYFARCGSAVKIGRARDVAARIATMQANNPQLVDCICTLTGRGHEEKRWHEMFAAQRIRGEWFEWTPELARAINSAKRGNKPWQTPCCSTSARTGAVRWRLTRTPTSSGRRSLTRSSGSRRSCARLLGRLGPLRPSLHEIVVPSVDRASVS